MYRYHRRYKNAIIQLNHEEKMLLRGTFPTRKMFLVFKVCTGPGEEKLMDLELMAIERFGARGN